MTFTKLNRWFAANQPLLYRIQPIALCQSILANFAVGVLAYEIRSLAPSRGTTSLPDRTILGGAILFGLIAYAYWHHKKEQVPQLENVLGFSQRLTCLTTFLAWCLILSPALLACRSIEERIFCIAIALLVFISFSAVPRCWTLYFHLGQSNRRADLLFWIAVVLSYCVSGLILGGALAANVVLFAFTVGSLGILFLSNSRGNRTYKDWSFARFAGLFPLVLFAGVLLGASIDSGLIKEWYIGASETPHPIPACHFDFDKITFAEIDKRLAECREFLLSAAQTKPSEGAIESGLLNAIITTVCYGALIGILIAAWIDWITHMYEKFRMLPLVNDREFLV